MLYESDIIHLDDLSITLVYPDSSTEPFILEAPNGDGGFTFGIGEIQDRHYRDGDRIKRKGFGNLYVVLNFDYSSHLMSLNKLLACSYCIIDFGNFRLPFDNTEFLFDKESINKNWFSNYVISSEGETLQDANPVKSGKESIVFNSVKIALITYIQDDAQVRAGDFADQNYGDLKNLRVKTDTPVSFTYWSYIKINISHIIEPVTSAKIRGVVYNIETSDPGPRTITISEVEDDTWKEETITWNTKPAKGNALDSVVIQDDDNEKSFDWDVTSWVNANVGDDFVSFVFTQDESSTIGLNIYSKEANPLKSIRMIVDE